MENWAKKFENLKNLVEKKVAKLKDFFGKQMAKFDNLKKIFGKKGGKI